jgi:mannose-6-phosphate isomerase-like protein (cupin superfamily)
MKIDSHKNNIIQKPWGYEYLVFENSQVALWALFIRKNHQTSMHCHPNKTTALIVLDGECEVNFLSNTNRFKALDKIMIRKGLFHSTKSISENGSIIFEIENPNNKQDLVRLDDNYGRATLPYEGKDCEFPKEADALWIDEEFNLSFNNFANCNLSIHRPTEVSFFEDFDDNTNFIILNGGLKTDYGINIVNPGDIINNSIAKKISKIFKKIDDNTIILLVEKNL